MSARWPSSWCSLLIWSCLTACSGSVGGNGISTRGADAGGGDAAIDRDPDAGTIYEGDDEDGGQAGPGPGSALDRALEDVATAECRPDPSEFAACGGDITGQWRIAAICLDADLDRLRESLMCPELTQEFTYDYRMLVDYKSSGNYTAIVYAAAEQTLLVPNSCVPDEADGDCSVAIGEDDTDDSDGRTVMVTKGDDGCTVEAHEQRSFSEAGTWDTAGNELTMTNSIGPRTSEYCMNGSSLIVRNVNTATNEVSWGVFERQ